MSEDIKTTLTAYVLAGQLCALEQASISNDPWILECSDIMLSTLKEAEQKYPLDTICKDVYKDAIVEHTEIRDNNKTGQISPVPEMISILSEKLVFKLGKSAEDLKTLGNSDKPAIWNAVWAGYFYTCEYLLSKSSSVEKEELYNILIGEILPTSLIDKSLYEAIQSNAVFASPEGEQSLDHGMIILDGITRFDKDLISKESKELREINLLLLEDMDPKTNKNKQPKFVMKPEASNVLDLQRDGHDSCAVWMYQMGIQVCLPGLTPGDIKVKVVNEKGQHIVRISINHRTIFIQRSHIDIHIEDPNSYLWSGLSMSKGILIIPKKTKKN